MIVVKPEDRNDVPGGDGFGSLSVIGRTDPWQVARLGLLLGVWILLPLILYFLTHHRLGLVDKTDVAIQRMEIAWGVMTALLGLALALALAYFIARQRALAQALERAINSMPVQFAYVDAEGRYRFHNRAYREACSPRARDIHGRTLRQVLGEAVYAQVAAQLARAMAGQQTDFELRLENGGPARDLSVTYLPDQGPGGQVKGLFVLANDITEHKRVERREKEHLLEMAHFSRLAGIGEIAAEIAHQINQPLAAIAMFSSASERILSGGGDQAQVLGWLATINAQSKRASEVIASLRRYVRPGTIEKGALDLNESLEEVASLLAHDAVSHHVELRRDLATGLPPVLATAILVEQVIFNLVRSAILAAAADAGMGQVTLRSRADEERVWVEILYDGPCRMGEFCQGMATPEAAGTDTGISLSQAVNRSIIAGFAGEFGCRCDEGSGTVCFFHLPRYEP